VWGYPQVGFEGAALGKSEGQADEPVDAGSLVVVLEWAIY
jgi:hypothetical protein